LGSSVFGGLPSLTFSTKYGYDNLVLYALDILFDWASVNGTVIRVLDSDIWSSAFFLFFPKSS
jgi:hypothetical protein